MKIFNNLHFAIYKKGFTLIELLIAIAIIGILSSFLLSNYVGVRQRARDGVRKSDLRQVQSALELYRSDQGNYPSSLPSCGSSLQDASVPPVVYMKKIPCDPSSTNTTLISYTYSYNGTTLTYTLTACLENSNDSQVESPVNAACTSTTNISYTIQNP